MAVFQNVYGRLENKPRNGNDSERQKWGSGGRMMVIRTSERLTPLYKSYGRQKDEPRYKNDYGKSHVIKMVMNPVIKMAKYCRQNNYEHPSYR